MKVAKTRGVIHIIHFIRIIGGQLRALIVCDVEFRFVGIEEPNLQAKYYVHEAVIRIR